MEEDMHNEGIMTAYPHQVEAAEFLSARKRALLADEPRVGKTGATLLGMAALGDQASRVLIITTASGRKVWQRAVRDWLGDDWSDRTAAYYTRKLTDEMLGARVLIIGWAALSKHAELLVSRGRFSLVVADEAHYAKDFKAQRTKALYRTVSKNADRLWLLTGTPMANGPLDLFPALQDFRALDAEHRTFYGFRDRYCVVRRMKMGRAEFDQIVGHKNLDELSERLRPHMLRRTQSDVGITEPIVETAPLYVKASDVRKILKELEKADPEAIEAFAGSGDVSDISPDHFATLRRITGTIKAPAVAEMIVDEIEGGADKLVVMAWHRDTMDVIEREVRNSGIRVVRVDGSTTPAQRDKREAEFREDDEVKVFLGQIVACGEAIDLSRSSDLLFAETSYVPKDMRQASLRITNHNQTRQPRVRIATLADSIDERVQAAVVRKMRDIKEVEGGS